MLNFDWISHLPLNWARLLVISAFLLPLLFVFTMRHQYVYQGAPDEHWWRNLKLWVLGLVIISISIYTYF